LPDFYVDKKNGTPRHLGASGFDFVDGRGRKFHYNADRNGRVVVDNPEHAKVIEQAARNDGGMIQKATGNSFRRTPSKYCKPCLFVAYRWQTACPKCGGPLDEGES
jgi:hypothetical protein